MLQGIWRAFLNIVREEEGSRVVETWFKAVTLERWDALEKVVHLEAPNAFVRDWICNNYLSLFQTHLGRLLNVESPKIIVNTLLEKSEPIPDQPTEKKGGSTTEVQTYHAAKVVLPKRQHNSLVRTPLYRESSHINRGYLFDSFVVGPSNSLAYAAAYAIAEKPGRLYNPMFIYGDTGLGKTHLLHAIGNGIKQYNKRATVLYQTADRFVNEFINAIRFDKVYRFQKKYKNVDVLLIDDIQFFSNKGQTQEAFFHIFNVLHDAKKQIVFSSDTYPQHMQGIAERLRSRLSWGLVTDIHVPSLETKVVILKKKADMSDVVLSDEVSYFIASRVTSNIRELEGALIRVTAFASLTKQEITRELAQKVLCRADQNLRSIDFNRVVKCVHKYYPYSLEKLRSKTRNKDLAFTRQLVMFLMKKMTEKSLRDIGAFFGGRNHATVKYAVDKIETYVESHQSFKKQLEQIKRDIAAS